MSKMRKNIVLPGIALVGGLVGLGLRKWELATAFDPASGLYLAGPATPALLIWSALVVLALVLLCRDCTDAAPFDTAFYAKGCTLYLTACVLSAFLLLLSGGLELLHGPLVNGSMLPAGLGRLVGMLLRPLRVGLCVLGFGCVLAVGRDLFRAGGRGRESLALLVLCVLLCVWLISEFQDRAVDPILLHYCYSLFAVLAAMLGFYCLTVWSFQTGKPRWTVVCCLLAVYLSLVTMADRHTLAELLRYGFVVLFLTAHTVLLLREHSAGEVPTETEDHHA